MEIWRYIKEHDNGITNFHFEVAADVLKDDEIELISDMRPGLIQLEIGVQSTNIDTITEIHRKMDFKKVVDIVTRINAGHNIHQHLDLIAGLPYEDLESFKQSFQDVYEVRPEQLQLGFLKVLKGSYMEKQKENYGLVYKDTPPYEVLYTKWLPYEDVLVLKKVEEMNLTLHLLYMIHLPDFMRRKVMTRSATAGLPDLKSYMNLYKPLQQKRILYYIKSC